MEVIKVGVKVLKLISIRKETGPKAMIE